MSKRRIASATGDSTSVSRFSCHAAKTKIPHETTTNALTNDGVNKPAGSARIGVRGFAASIEASASRLKAIAAERAETMATMIHASWWPGGQTPARQHRPAERKRERENRVLPLDHFKGYAEIAQERHEYDFS